MNKQTINEQISKIVAELDLLLYCIETVSENHENIFRINIYSENKKINLRDCTRVHKSIYPLLEENIALTHSIQVGSIGIEKPLLEHWHYELAVNEQVQIKAIKSSKIIGVLQKVFDDKIEVLVDDEVIEVKFLDIKKAKTLFLEKSI